MVALKRGAFKKRGKQSRTEKDWIIKCLKMHFLDVYIVGTCVIIISCMRH